MMVDVPDPAASPLLHEVVRRGPVLAVVAHPDDESFGLGAVLHVLVEAGIEVRVLCLTHGEASTLGARPDLGAVRSGELEAASSCLGVSGVMLHDFPDGGLDGMAAGALDGVVEASLGAAATLAVFEPGGVTGHQDHRAATAAAQRVAARLGLALLEWGLAPEVATTLNDELGVAFVALEGAGVVDLVVDRSSQLAAIACHASQATDNPVLLRRLELEGGVERVRLTPPGPPGEARSS
jgi:LmbE family N-acetylglucosaminyl deacetylase